MSWKEIIKINVRGLKLLYSMVPIKKIGVIAFIASDVGLAYWPYIFMARFIDDLLAHAPEQTIWADFLLMTAGEWVLRILFKLFMVYYFYGGCMTWEDANRCLNQKLMSMDYEYMESETIQNQRRDIDAMARKDGGGLCYLFWNATPVVERFLHFFIAAGVVLHLLSRSSLAFHGILWKQIVFSVLFLGLLAALLALSFFKNKAQQEKIYQYNEETLPDNRNYNFYINEYICKGECGKTIRMFGQQNILYQAILKMFQRTNENTQKRYQAERTQGQWVGSIQMLISGFVYLMLGLMALNKAISIGSICLYAGCVTNFVHHFNLWIQNLSRLISNTKYVKKYFDFMDTPNIKYEGTLPVEKRDDDRFIMEFRHVTFRYPGSDVDALKDFSIKFRIGEKLAVVGRNGSGKTTFIKLLCRLYDPTEGEILLNGIDIRKYDYREYLSLFSVVFQDFQIPAFSVGQTVAAAENYDKERVRDAISRAGLSEFLEKLPYGLDTYITKDYDKNGVDISGGEAQKLAIARALYHDTPFVVLDEPTAALDPLAEYEVYAGFDELIGTKTAVYISHRLSNCQFCDDILVIDQGRAVQRGNHQKLIQEEGLYASLWNAQAQYYQTGQQ